MSHLTDKQLQELRAQIEKRLENLHDYNADIEASDPKKDPNRDQYNESGEEAVENYEMLESETLSETAEEMMNELQAALDRMAAGTYGVDEQTGEPIPFARLQLYPEARTNVDTPAAK